MDKSDYYFLLAVLCTGFYEITNEGGFKILALMFVIASGLFLFTPFKSKGNKDEV